jgi:hypothetical protein
MVDLKVAWCNHDAARYAVRHWHYAKNMPGGGHVKVGVWEDGAFIGVILFSMGANRHIGGPYGLSGVQVCELTRVALREHTTPVTRMLSQAISMLKKQCPGLRLVVSYADQNHGHHGGIYQAGNWTYVGEVRMDAVLFFGKPTHRRTIYSHYNTNSIEWLRANVDPNVRWIEAPGKYKYLYPLDKAMRRQIAALALPYPPPMERDGDGC